MITALFSFSHDSYLLCFFFYDCPYLLFYILCNCCNYDEYYDYKPEEDGYDYIPCQRIVDKDELVYNAIAHNHYNYSYDQKHPLKHIRTPDIFFSHFYLLSLLWVGLFIYFSSSNKKYPYSPYYLLSNGNKMKRFISLT